VSAEGTIFLVMTEVWQGAGYKSEWFFFLFFLSKQNKTKQNKKWGKEELIRINHTYTRLHPFIFFPFR